MFFGLPGEQIARRSLTHNLVIGHRDVHRVVGSPLGHMAGDAVGLGLVSRRLGRGVAALANPVVVALGGFTPRNIVRVVA